jgi:hypothetical protein
VLRFSVSLAFVITNKKFRPKWRNPAVNLHAIVPIPIQRNTLDLLSCEKHIESYLNLKEVNNLKN